MNVKRILITALISLVAAGLVCVVLVGMINGVWPWSGSSFGADYTGPRPGETTETTAETGETTTTGTEGTTEATTEESVPTTAEQEEEKSTRPTLDNKIPVDVIVTEPTKGTDSEETDPTEPTKGTEGEDTETTKPTEGTDDEETDTTKPTDKTYIDFDEMYNPNKR